MKTMTPVTQLVAGDHFYSSTSQFEATVEKVETIVPDPGDEYRYDDFRGAGPYTRIHYSRPVLGTDIPLRTFKNYPSNAAVYAGEGF